MTGREPLTYYDMNLSAQDHQTFFTCDSDHLRPADASKEAVAHVQHAGTNLKPWSHAVCVCVCVCACTCVCQLCRRRGERGTHRPESLRRTKPWSWKSELTSSSSLGWDSPCWLPAVPASLSFWSLHRQRRSNIFS